MGNSVCEQDQGNRNFPKKGISKSFEHYSMTKNRKNNHRRDAGGNHHFSEKNRDLRTEWGPEMENLKHAPDKRGGKTQESGPPTVVGRGTNNLG